MVACLLVASRILDVVLALTARPLPDAVISGRR